RHLEPASFGVLEESQPPQAKGETGQMHEAQNGQRGRILVVLQAKMLSLNLSLFVEDQNNQNTCQIPPCGLSLPQTDLKPPARSVRPARTHSVAESSAGTERTQHTLAGCIYLRPETPAGRA